MREFLAGEPCLFLCSGVTFFSTSCGVDRPFVSLVAGFSYNLSLLVFFMFLLAYRRPLFRMQLNSSTHMET